VFQIKVKIQKDLFTDLINLILGGVAKIRSRSHQFFKMEHPAFDSRI